MIRIIAFTLISWAMIMPSNAQFQTEWGKWTSWGEQKNGTYANPVIPADFSDVDCICHDGWYYMISSSFQYQPGMVILKSADMVNWVTVGHAIKDIRQISPDRDWRTMNCYGQGVWAGAIRWWDGRFYVYFGDPQQGYFMTSAEKAEGPWDDLHPVLREGGWDDCCPLKDDDGKIYFIGTSFHQGYKTYIWQMTDDGKELIPETKTFVIEGYGREANKLYKWNGKYYHLFSEASGGTRFVCMERADNPLGPYTDIHRINLAEHSFHEPNQGGLLQDADGKWFFLTHHGDGEWAGRLVSLVPVTWEDGWPILGEPDENGVGKFIWNYTMPKPFHKEKIKADKLLEWEWNYYPREDKYVLDTKKKELTLYAFPPLEKDNFLKAGNTLTHRTTHIVHGEETIKMDISGMEDGQKAGISQFSSSYALFGVVQKNGKRVVFYQKDGEREKKIDTIKSQTIWLRTNWDWDGTFTFSYSTDGKKFKNVLQKYQAHFGHYRGTRLGLFTYNDEGERGKVVFNLK